MLEILHDDLKQILKEDIQEFIKNVYRVPTDKCIDFFKLFGLEIGEKLK